MNDVILMIYLNLIGFAIDIFYKMLCKHLPILDNPKNKSQQISQVD